MSDVIDLSGKTVIVTGASSGIGAATARALHAAGALPVLAGTPADRLTGLSEELGGALAVPTDVTDPEQVHGLVAATTGAAWARRRLVNNAGAKPRRCARRHRPRRVPRILDLNVVSLIGVTQAVLPAMRGQGFGRNRERQLRQPPAERCPASARTRRQNRP